MAEPIITVSTVPVEPTVTMTVSSAPSEHLNLHERLASRIVPTIPASRTLALPIGPQPTTVGNFTLKSGRGYSIRKQSGTCLAYGVDVQAWLEDAGTGLRSVALVGSRGVEVVGDAFIQGTVVGALVNGLNEMAGAVNSITLRFTCLDGQASEVSIFFVKG